MKDMTEGSVTKHLLQMSAFLFVSMLAQTLYLLADLYWVGSLGKEAIAAVGLSSTLMMVVLAVTQTLGVGTTTVISHAAGQKNQPRAELVFNQSFVLSMLVGLVLSLCAFLLRDWYGKSISADAPTAALTKSYLFWFIPALMLQFPLVALGSALRATGIVKPAVAVQVLSVLLNIVLAPLLIFGLGPLPKLGVGGAALATFLSVLVANVLLAVYYVRSYRYLRFRLSLLGPEIKIWWAMLKVGLPAGAEFALMSVYIMLVYVIIRRFGAEAQAGFGVGARVMQAMFLPAMALSFAVGPVVGQNFGGRRADRVRSSFYSALGISTLMMVLLTLIAQIAPQALIRVFSKDPGVIAFGSDYLRIISLNFVAVGIVFTTSSVFQGIGNTVPPLVSSMTRLLLFAGPAVVLSARPDFQIRYVWYFSVGSILIQAIVNFLLLQREFRKKLVFDEATSLTPASGGVASVG
ncbi:MAG TPA: MATE family efflux transporter [Chthoniobacterales bacterium]|nr:MATE family efflux transporter [Chthoniobacterales bacterium]